MTAPDPSQMAADGQTAHQARDYAPQAAVESQAANPRRKRGGLG